MQAICGVYLGLTKEPTTIDRRPAADSASSSASFWPTVMSADSICIPSRMHSSLSTIFG